MDLNKNNERRRLTEQKNRLVKRMNFAEQRLEKYAFAMGDDEMKNLLQRIDEAAAQLADVNDKLLDLEEGINQPERWSGHASTTLRKSSQH